MSSRLAVSQNAVADWFPVQVGDKWIYLHETRDDTGEGPAHPEIHLWKTEETVVRLSTIPEGTLVELQVRLIEGTAPQWGRADSNPAYLVRGDCLYTSVDWDHRTHQLTAEYREDLLDGHTAPDFCFPLVLRKTWGAPHWADWRPPAEAQDWKVVAVKLHDPSALDKQRTFHITSVSSYLGSGMTADIWFEKDVGIVREELIHHGTVGEERTRLLRFEPASRR